MSKNTILDRMPMDLGDKLVLRFATPEDTDELVNLNARLHEDSAAGVAVSDLMPGKHPTTHAGDFTVIEDINARKIVSSMCLTRKTGVMVEFPLN